MAVLGEPVSAARLGSLALVVADIVGLKLSSSL
jgi:multidrug transporter EmrE-like cation transporter